jgi:hypothetical protein
MRSFSLSLVVRIALAPGCVGLLLVGILASQSANATPITFNFTGTATNTTGIFAGQGTAVTGFYTFDTALVDTFPGDATNDWFQNHTPVGNQGLTFEISLTLGSVTRTTANNLNPATFGHHRVIWRDGASMDQFEIRAIHVTSSDDDAALNLEDFTPSPPDGVAAGSGNLTDTPILTAPNIALFDTVIGNSFYRSWNSSGVNDGTVIFTLTSITPIPEPSTALLLATGLAALAVGRRRLSTR